MRTIELASPVGAGGDHARLYVPELPTSRLLVTLAGPLEAATANLLGEDGWSILSITSAKGDSDTPSLISELIAQAAGQLAAVASPLRIVAAADGAVETAAFIKAITESHRSGSAAVRGLVALDPFAASSQEGLNTDESIAEFAEGLLPFNGLAIILAARASSTDQRRLTLALHRRLQALGKDSRFLAIRDNGGSLPQWLANGRDQLGREFRWLLDPVHSRNET